MSDEDGQNQADEGLSFLEHSIGDNIAAVTENM